MQTYEQKYHLGIIDFLQDWSLQKRLERFVKSCCKKRGFKKELSAVPPPDYQKRFTGFVHNNVLLPAYLNYSYFSCYKTTQDNFVDTLLK